MKKHIILVLAFLTFITVGCEFKQNNQSHEPIIYFEEYGSNENNPLESEMIYQDVEHKYFLGSYKKTYVEYNGKQYNYSEALKKNIVTMDDLKKADVQIYQRICNNYKISDELRIYVEEISPYETQPAVINTIYEDSKYSYVISPYKEAYVEYNGKRYDYFEALKQQIVTLDDLVKAGVRILKKEIGVNKYEEYTGK